MNHFEIDDCLRSMQIIVDSNEQPSRRAKKRYETFGCPYMRQKIDYGDYTYNFMLPNGEWLHELNTRVFPYFASITAWQARYRIQTIFCKSETSGRIIKEILYRELKERLEQGFYDSEVGENGISINVPRGG